MPTGYTYLLEEKPDITLAQFIVHCAPAFGVHTPSTEGMPLPSRVSFKFDENETKRLEEALKAAQAEVNALGALPEEVWLLEYEAYVKGNAEANARETMRVEKWAKTCKRLLAAAERWVPPTEKHVEIKKFVVDQIQQTLEHDGTAYLSETIDYQKWVMGRIKQAANSVGHHTQWLLEEQRRRQVRKAWVNALNESLNSLQAIEESNAE